MSKFIIVSNRLPIKIEKQQNQWIFSPTSGGLATGLKSVHENGKSLWIGWPGISSNEIDDKEYETLSKGLLEKKFKPISLSNEEIDDFYLGLSNKCIWPLFHYFKQHFQFDEQQWDAYVKVNQKFANAILEEIEEGDQVWVHDYQLLLVPEMIKSIRKDVTIGFFLHIPFPSFEIFRIFPKREELLKGMLGSDLIGFHTYDYERHFLSSVRRILHLNVNFNLIQKGDREIVVNTFPMGIDYEKFEKTAYDHTKSEKESFSPLRIELEKHKELNQGKIILSIDRLDYTKGVINRVKSFELFLTQYPEYKEKVRMLMVLVPSRANVSHYKELKRETDEIIGRVNGNFATVNWTPIWYYYRSFDFDDLINLYRLSDVAMVTPLRDGMNLVAKEYLATRIQNDGVLILSELAGASKELHQSLIVNPFDITALSNTIHEALNMPLSEQVERNTELRERVKRYNITFWSETFLKELDRISKRIPIHKTKRITPNTISKFEVQYALANKRLFLLDYDGTLVPFHKNHKKALPSPTVINLLKELNQDPKNKVIIISGRPPEFLDQIFKDLNLTMIAEHGHFEKEPQKEWIEKNASSSSWMNHIYPILQQFTDNTPGTFIEQKRNSLVWHFRKTDPELGVIKSEELKTVLSSMLSNDISLMDGDKIIEVTTSTTNKGIASYDHYAKEPYDFVLVAGDDVTDENMFTQLPNEVISIKVGNKKSVAKHSVVAPQELINLLNHFKK
ncbi:bifunctional alpha,alpha-trehalose-phosphate synthase (UDP-forming)/trehalose-phosphatase [Flavobacteriaceae bacterium]|nr:bifunctional alpha,alpha-trehalose-phosphate synthase (UDP-forming)/trehalose-phosphatase [Flavobacteriaceae bacterium]MDB2341055.1 bifunctional alpha,alpha-trehalose-phosphate synthase (UDP-forming)/trehalose-phosphatase [Flavobacteriaceae bacterium]